MNEDEIMLIQDAKKGSKKALEKIIRKEQNNIYSTLFYLKKDDNELNDIMQDVLIKLSRHISKLKNPQNFKTWLNQIIVNSYYDYIRKNKKHSQNCDIDDIKNQSEMTFSNSKVNPSNSILYSELDCIIKNSIENLPIHYKIPITLREIQGLTYNEISNITKTTIGTVKSRIARARAIIKDDIYKYSRS